LASITSHYIPSDARTGRAVDGRMQEMIGTRIEREYFPDISRVCTKRKKSQEERVDGRIIPMPGKSGSRMPESLTEDVIDLELDDLDKMHSKYISPEEKKFKDSYEIQLRAKKKEAALRGRSYNSLMFPHPGLPNQIPSRRPKIIPENTRMAATQPLHILPVVDPVSDAVRASESILQQQRRELQDQIFGMGSGFTSTGSPPVPQPSLLVSNGRRFEVLEEDERESLARNLFKYKRIKVKYENLEN
jgi:hypothetical protein